MPRSNSDIDFEATLKELTDIVDQLEKGGIPLEKALAHFERGISLTRSCHDALNKAQQRVNILIEKNGIKELQPFETENT